MKKAFLTLFFISVFCSCSQRETVEGVLFFKLVDFGSFYNVDDAKIESFEKEIDSVINTPDVRQNWKDFYDYIQRLKEHGLIKKPFVFLELSSDSVIRIYLSEKEYEKVKMFKKSELQKMGEKVEIELEIEKKDKALYYSDRIIEVNVVEGKTPWKK